MEGIYFYWFAWIGWAFTTFIMEKNKLRLFLSIVILTVISLATIEIIVFGYGVNSVLILLLLVGYWKLSKLPFFKLLYYVITTGILSLAYVGFSLFALYDPVWVIFDYSWLLAFTLFILTLFLVKNQVLRIVSIVIGSVQGEMIYGVILSSILGKQRIGSLMFFDMLSMVIVLTFIWYSFERFVHYIDEYIKRKHKKKDMVVNG